MGTKSFIFVDMLSKFTYFFDFFPHGSFFFQGFSSPKTLELSPNLLMFSTLPSLQAKPIQLGTRGQAHPTSCFIFFLQGHGIFRKVK